ncbi:MAG: EAL domain-containing protein [Wenzhouxiangella sp.]
MAWGLLVVVSALVLLLLHHQHKTSVENLLSHSLTAQKISWDAVQALQRNSVSTYLEQYVYQPQTLALLRAAQSPEAREESRAQLFELLEPGFRHMAARGIGLFHFHLPDGESFLRFHDPDRFGDDLTSVRESIRQVNATLKAVHGFEAGRLVAGYRSVYPIVDEDGVHLGSVEFSLPFPALLQDLEQLVPELVFEVLLERSLVQDMPVEGLAEQYRPWPGSAQFVVASRQGSGNSRFADRLARAVGEDPALRARVEAAAPSGLRLGVDGVDFVMTLQPMVDPGGVVAGLLLSYAQETALTDMDRAFRLNAFLALIAMLLLGVGAHYLIRVASEKFAERERLDLITRSLGQGMYALNGQGVITEVNPRACHLLGFDPEELVGQKAHEMFHIHPSDPGDASLPCPILAATSRGERFTGEQRFRRRDGRDLDVSLTSMPLSEREGSVTLFDDISRRKENERKLHNIAHYDALTGLPNRVLLADRLALAMARARRTKTPLVLAFVDLDGFKAVNDTHGHNVGDSLLIVLSRRMQRCLRETDTVARIGGDEFAVVMNDLADLAAYTRLINRLLVALAIPEKIEGHEVRVSASIGVSLYPQPDDIDADQLLRQADQAMYEAKLAGKNRYRLFDVERDGDLRGRHEYAEQIRGGLERDELLLYFQPKVNMASGELMGAEALIRWQHPDKGLLQPSSFLPLISRHSLEVDLGRWVLRRALAQMTIWQRKGLNLPLSVNVTGEYLQQPGFVTELSGLLRRYPEVPPSHLQLEVVESTALEDVAAVSEVIARCMALGVEVALDDFGTGYSSLTFLRRLPVRVLKMDQAFVSNMLHDPDDLAILDGVLNLARAFRMQAVAEGVATVQHGRALRQLGCEVAQGYAIGRPMPAAGMGVWVEQWRLPQAWAQVTPLDRRSLEFLYAEVEHRAWMRNLVEYCKGGVETAPPFDALESRLRRSLRAASSGPRARSLAEQVLTISKQMHKIAERMSRIRRQTDAHAALACLAELEPLHHKCLQLLQQLTQSPPAENR